jgi:hypothetical protein
MVDGNFTCKTMMTVAVRIITLILDMPMVVTELALMQEVTESSVVVLTFVPFTENFTACWLLSPWVFKNVYSFESNSVGEMCTASKATTYVGVDHVCDVKGSIHIS